ncbi:MAG: RdgB/HAM1 family non-canonical purine NTP pyrophosphatase [Balneolaceae bacterium]
MIQELVLASRNPHKIEEMQAILQSLGIQVLSTKDFPNLEEVEEDQPDLKGNALKKARYISKEIGLPALSDDTGLEVEALDGAPGVFSARYAGEEATYQDNVLKLLGEMEGESNRKAQFRTVVALVKDGEEFTFEGICAGEIIPEQRGEGGFGYDPVFKPEGYSKTFSELDASTKNMISHRGKAVQQFIDFLTNNSN